MSEDSEQCCTSTLKLTMWRPHTDHLPKSLGLDTVKDFGRERTEHFLPFLLMGKTFVHARPCHEQQRQGNDWDCILLLRGRCRKGPTGLHCSLTTALKGRGRVGKDRWGRRALAKRNTPQVSSLLSLRAELTHMCCRQGERKWSF